MPELESLRLLLVDDDPAVLRVYERLLAQHGATVETVTSGGVAAQRVQAGSYDVIVSDISMPEMTGIEFLREVRSHDLDVPVILMTGEPSLESAVLSVECGAFRYLSKPVTGKELRASVLHAAKLHKLAKLKREALDLVDGGAGRRSERAAEESRFSSCMELMTIYFQPIVKWSERRVFGYEALLRSAEPSMNNPADILDSAERLGHLFDLGRAVRARVAAEAHEAPEDAWLFVNLHASDLTDEELYSPDSPLSRIASRVVLEVTERCSLSGIKDIAARVAKLSQIGFQIAIDDLGAGYAGLTSFTQLAPTIAKLDMVLIRGIDGDAQLQIIVRSMKALCDDLNILVVAEGVETVAERNTLVELGCDLLQGYLFARPRPGFEQIAL
jgi:EAL domain-containing protein (putative c-di-GMP-specific phosphodiesterase class I)